MTIATCIGHKSTIIRLVTQLFNEHVKPNVSYIMIFCVCGIRQVLRMYNNFTISGRSVVAK